MDSSKGHVNAAKAGKKTMPPLLLSPPTLELLFSCDSGTDIAEGLHIDQRVDIAAIGEAFD